MRAALPLVCLGASVALGCATVFRGTRQTVRFVSSHPGVRVDVDGQTIETPGKARLRRGQSHIYRASGVRCREMTGVVTSRTCHDPGFWCTFDLVTACMLIGLPGLAVDLGSGALSSLEPGTIHVELPECSGDAEAR